MFLTKQDIEYFFLSTDWKTQHERGSCYFSPKRKACRCQQQTQTKRLQTNQLVLPACFSYMEILACKSPKDMLKSHSLVRMLVCRVLLPRALCSHPCSLQFLLGGITTDEFHTVHHHRAKLQLLIWYIDYPLSLCWMLKHTIWRYISLCNKI